MDSVSEHLSNIVNIFDFILLLLHSDTSLHKKIYSAFTAKLNGRTGLAVTGAQADQLLNVYSLYAFTDKLIVGSFDLPHGRKLRNLLDCGIATEEQLIHDVILGAM